MTAPRLMLPSYDIGAAHILSGGKCTGFALAEFYCWRAYLFPVARDSRTGAVPGCEEVTARTLGELRRRLRERVEVEGPWWT